MIYSFRCDDIFELCVDIYTVVELRSCRVGIACANVRACGNYVSSECNYELTVAGSGAGAVPCPRHRRARFRSRCVHHYGLQIYSYEE